MNLKRHIGFEFSLHNLLERWGVSDNLFEIACQVRDAVVDCIDNGEYNKTILIRPKVSTDFKAIKIHFDIEIDKSKHERDSEYLFDSELWIPEIEMKLKGSRMFIINSVISIVIHELTHAMDDFSSRDENGNQKFISDYYKLSLIVLQNRRFFKADTINFAKCIYWLSPQERNANLSTLEFDLNNTIYKITDKRTAEKAIKETSLYNKYVSIKKLVDLYSSSDGSIVLKNIATDMSSSIEDIDVDFNYLKRCLKWMNLALKRFEYKFETNSSKISCEMALTNNPNLTKNKFI